MSTKDLEIGSKPIRAKVTLTNVSDGELSSLSDVSSTRERGSQRWCTDVTVIFLCVLQKVE